MPPAANAAQTLGPPPATAIPALTSGQPRRAIAAWRWPGGGGVFRFVLRRVALALLTLLGLATVAFIMIKLIPGDEARVAAGPDAAVATVEATRTRLGLDQPVVVQYGRFIARLLHADLGTSIVTYQPVIADLMRVLPNTLELIILTLVLNFILAVPTATIAASRQGRAVDGLSRAAAVIAIGLPVFWLALMLQYLLGTVWRVLPISGVHGFGLTSPRVTGFATIDALLAGNPASLLDAITHLAMPAAVLTVHFSAQLFRALRVSLLAVLASEFIPPLRAKGASERRILLRHALPNGLAPVLTLAGAQIADLVGAAVIVETIFARQGVGAYLANAVAQKDTFAVVGAVLFIGAMVCVVNLLVDVALLLVDPRLRSGQGMR